MSVLEPGSIFGRDFRIVKSLRTGGMGSVYVVDQVSTGKQRALKVMAPELASDPAIRERFVLEARAAAAIESDHVVEIVTAGVDEETEAPFLVMELLRGEELFECLVRTGPLPLGDVAEILQQVGHALELAHRHGIVHRDLKLENIFLCASRRRDVAFTAKILDFGIAKLVAEGQRTGTQPLGTPVCMAPEQTERRGRICPATDVWALGLIAFTLITGRFFWLEPDALPALLREICVNEVPFATARVQELTQRIQAADPRAAPLPALPPGFDAWFARCVNRDIDARFQDAGEAVRAFAELVAADAPRGVVVVVAGHVSSPPGISTLSMEMPARVPVRTPIAVPPSSRRDSSTTTGVGNTEAPTVSGATERSSTRRPLRPMSRRAIAWVVGPVLLVGGAAGFFFLPGALSQTGSAASPGGAASALPVANASGAALLANAQRCPEGMAIIEGGKMFMGARDLNDAAKPPHEVTVSTFCLDKREVTTKAYLACVEKGECERPPDHVSWTGIQPDQEKRFSPLCNVPHPERGDHPINCVAWAMADNYCKKHEMRLPTEAEWEFAARGTSQWKYPWGNDMPSAKYLNACGKECMGWGEMHNTKLKVMYEEDDGFPMTAPVGSFPAGASVHGVLDLAGNVWEWTADWFAPYKKEAQKDPKGPPSGAERVVRGGDFFGYEPEWARPAYRFQRDPETYNHAIGFRCAAEPPRRR